jgi:hypothetical protein
MRLPKLAALVIALVSATLLSNSAVALSQDVGGISCDVISDYGATSPAYFEVFQAFLEGYLAGQKKLGPDSRDAAGRQRFGFIGRSPSDDAGQSRLIVVGEHELR